MEKGRPPGRLRHSWEARCRLVQMMLSGVGPQAAAVACGMSWATAYRLLHRFQDGGWEGLRDRCRWPCTVRIGSRLRRRRRSWSCGGGLVGGRGRCRRRWAGRRRRSGEYWCGMAAHEPSGRLGRRRIGMSTPRWASWCTWTSRSWVASGTSANGYSTTACSEAAGPAGGTPTSPSTTTPGSPMSSCAAQNAAMTAPSFWTP
jgi:Winged helix-turn helix